MDYENEVCEQEMEQKIRMKDRIASVLENAKDFVADHTAEIAYGIYLGGMAIIFGQSIRYMHLLNKSAAKGIFPGYQSR